MPDNERYRYAYNSLVYFGEDVAQSVDRVARFGYDAIEIVGEPDQSTPPGWPRSPGTPASA